MSRKLSEMSREELWRLFPICLTEHCEGWAAQYAQMEATLKSVFADRPALRISHIGSTAISGIWAKPIVDILIEISENDDMEEFAALLELRGFTRMSAERGRVSLNHGYTENGFADRVYHLHLRYAGDNDELYFRDYLNEFPETAGAYEQLKLKLWKEYEFDRDSYTAAKGEFVDGCTRAAKARYGKRYC